MGENAHGLTFKKADPVCLLREDLCLHVSSRDTYTEEGCGVQLKAQKELAGRPWVKNTEAINSFSTQCVWLCCKQIYQFFFCCISNIEAAQSVFAALWFIFLSCHRSLGCALLKCTCCYCQQPYCQINQDINLKDYNVRGKSKVWEVEALYK